MGMHCWCSGSTQAVLARLHVGPRLLSQARPEGRVVFGQTIAAGTGLMKKHIRIVDMNCDAWDGHETVPNAQPRAPFPGPAPQPTPVVVHLSLCSP